MGQKRVAATEGLADRDIRALLDTKSVQEVSAFLRRAMKENKVFRRKVLAWLIDVDADRLPFPAVHGEVQAWIQSVFEQRSWVSPRTPDLRELAPVKTAVRNHPELAVPAHIAIVEGIEEFFDTFGRGPESFYEAILRSFQEAATQLPAVVDRDRRLHYLERLTQFSDRSADFGYGLDRDTAAVLHEVRDAVIGTPSPNARDR